MPLHNFQFFTLETMIIQFILISIILFILNKFLFKPYLEYLDKEGEKRLELEKKYLNIDTIIKKSKAEADGIIAGARKKSEEIISNSNSLAKKTYSELIEKAEKESKLIIESGKSEIEKERMYLFESMKQKILNIALSINGKLFSDKEKNRDFVENQIKLVDFKN